MPREKCEVLRRAASVYPDAIDGRGVFDDGNCRLSIARRHHLLSSECNPVAGKIMHHSGDV